MPDDDIQTIRVVLPETKVVRIENSTPFGVSTPYLSNNTARVDPSGDDSTGTVGDESKPFLTRQVAITALENSGITFTQSTPAVLIVPAVDSFEDITTSLQYLAILGVGFISTGAPAIGSLTLTNDGGTSGTILTLDNLYVGNVSALNNVDQGLIIYLHAAQLTGDCTTSCSLYINALFNLGLAGGTISPGAGLELHITGLRGGMDGTNSATINAPGSDVYLIDSYINTITAAGTITMQDSVVSTNNSGVTPTHEDFFSNPLNFDFSTLPTIEPTQVGAAWIDTTGGNNIVKVKL